MPLGASCASCVFLWQSSGWELATEPLIASHVILGFYSLFDLAQDVTSSLHLETALPSVSLEGLMLPTSSHGTLVEASCQISFLIMEFPTTFICLSWRHPLFPLPPPVSVCLSPFSVGALWWCGSCLVCPELTTWTSAVLSLLWTVLLGPSSDEWPLFSFFFD